MAWAPVLCLVCQIEDPPVSPWQSDTYFEVAHSLGRRLVEHLGQQETLKLFILDDGLQTVGATQIPWGDLQQQEAQALLARALTDLRAIPPEGYDFPRAKAAFLRRWSLRELLGVEGD